MFSLMASTDGPRALGELLNVAHERPFSLLFANYSLMLGIAGGAAILWAFLLWYSSWERSLRDHAAFRLAPLIAVSLIAAGFLNVLAEVQQPSRLIYGYLFGWTYWDTAIIKYGIILLPLLLMLCWWLTFQCLPREDLEKRIAPLSSPWREAADFFSLWSRRYSVFDNPLATNLVLIAMVLLGLFAALYSGIFLMGEHGVPLWNSPALPVLFLSTGLAGAVLILIGLIPIVRSLLGDEPTVVVSSQKEEKEEKELRGFGVVFLFLSAFLWLVWMWGLKHFGGVEELRAVQLFQDPYEGMIVAHWWFIGLFIPIGIMLTPLWNSQALKGVAAVAALWGAYMIRVIILAGGQAGNRSGAGYLSFTPGGEVFWYSGFSLLFLVFLLALMLLLLPHPKPNAHAETG